LHVDDGERIDAYGQFARLEAAPSLTKFSARECRLLRMLVASLNAGARSDSLETAAATLWLHPAVLREVSELLPLLRSHDRHLHEPLDVDGVNPLALHARYTRTEILSAFGVGKSAHPVGWQAGVWWDAASGSDLFAFTLDKSSGRFSPTTRYRDYAISRELIHWESQSATAEASETGQRYINHLTRGTKIVLFARLSTNDRAFWCLGPASYVRHQGERPIAFVWKLERPLPADLYTEFAAAVA
jgi:hypothetical protein